MNVVTDYEIHVLRAMRGPSPVTADEVAARIAEARPVRNPGRHLRWTRQDLRRLVDKGAARLVRIGGRRGYAATASGAAQARRMTQQEYVAAADRLARDAWARKEAA